MYLGHYEEIEKIGYAVTGVGLGGSRQVIEKLLQAHAAFAVLSECWAYCRSMRGCEYFAV